MLLTNSRLRWVIVLSVPVLWCLLLLMAALFPERVQDASAWHWLAIAVLPLLGLPYTYKVFTNSGWLLLLWVFVFSGSFTGAMLFVSHSTVGSSCDRVIYPGGIVVFVAISTASLIMDWRRKRQQQAISNPSAVPVIAPR